MSAYLMGRVFYTELPSHLKLTMLALADHASDDGTGITVGQARLARKVGGSERAVRGHLAELREAGWIVKLNRLGSRGQDRHRIVVEQLPTAEQIALLTPPRPERPAGRQPAATRQASASRPATQRRLDRKPVAAEPSENHQLEPTTARAIWDAFTSTLGWGPKSRAERGKWNAAIKQWREAELGAADVASLVSEYRRRWPRVNCNPMAVVAHLGELEARPSRERTPEEWTRLQIESAYGGEQPVVGR